MANIGWIIFERTADNDDNKDKDDNVYSPLSAGLIIFYIKNLCKMRLRKSFILFEVEVEVHIVIEYSYIGYNSHLEKIQPG